MTHSKKDIRQLGVEEIAEFFIEIGDKTFRAPTTRIPATPC